MIVAMAVDGSEIPGVREMLDGLPAVVIVARAPSGEIVFANRLAERLVRRSLVGTIDEVAADVQLVTPAGRSLSYSEWPLVRCIRSGHEIHEEELVVFVGGSRRVFSCSCAPVLGDEGELVAGGLVAHDITERKRTEERLAYTASLLDNVDDAVVATDPDFRLTLWNRGAERLYGFPASEVLGRHASEVASYVGDESRAVLERELRSSDRTSHELTAYRKDGSRVEVELTAVAVRDRAGELTGYLGIHRDITERKRSERGRRAARRELERRAAQQAGVAQLGLHAFGGRDLEPLMDDAARVVARTLDVELVRVDELLPGGTELLVRAGVGWRPGVVGAETVPGGNDSAAGYALASAKPVVALDVDEERRFNTPAVIHEHGVRSLAAVVIAGHGTPFGVLAAFSRAPRRFSQDDVNFLQAVAHVLATAVERSLAQRRLRDAREAERRRIARDLHDEALRDLSLALAEAQRADEAGELIPALKRVGRRLRAAIYDLSLAAEEQRPLPELLHELVLLHRALAEGELRIELDVRSSVPEGSLGQRGTELLRIVGEALTNARRHAKARTIRLGAWAAEHALCVEIGDDGIGFDVDEPAPPARTGLRGMRERAAGIGCALTVRSTPGKGTRVRAELPLVAGRWTPGQPVRVLLVDDHAAVRDAIALAFDTEPDFEIAGQAGSLAEARGMLAEVDVAVIDLGLPDGYGGDLIRELREVNPDAQALVLSASLDRSAIARAVDRGAAGVLEKTARLDDVVQSVRRLHAGETLLPVTEVVELLRVAAREREREQEDRRAIARLTPRERDVLQLLAEGLDSQGIAERLHISIRTERNHIANILAKLGVHSQLQALVFALRYELVELR